MSTQTPSAPPPPVAAALSPVLWQMNLPDRFDVYSAGLIMLQMVRHIPREALMLSSGPLTCPWRLESGFAIP